MRRVKKGERDEKIYINFCSKLEIISVFFLPSPHNKT
jgi:hypothetical protein